MREVGGGGGLELGCGLGWNLGRCTEKNEEEGGCDDICDGYVWIVAGDVAGEGSGTGG